MERSAAASPSESGTAIHFPESPAPRGYLTNPYFSTADKAHRILNSYLSSESLFQESKIINGIKVSLQHRTSSITPTKAPTFKGTTFIAHFRPIEIFNFIHLFGYRLIWDTRMSSARVIQRYGQYKLAFYALFRGIGPIYEPRDSVGVQDVRCCGPNHTPQKTAFPNTELIDLTYKSIQTPEVPTQQGKAPMDIHIGGFRIERLEELKGCDVTFVGDVDLGASLPTCIWNVLSRELPVNVGRLRSSLEQFGYPPYVLDQMEIVVLQSVYYFPLTRITTLRKHVSKTGTYIIAIDRDRMYPAGVEWPPDVEGEGANFVPFKDQGSQILVTVGPQAVGKEYIVTLNPKDADKQPT